MFLAQATAKHPQDLVDGFEHNSSSPSILVWVAGSKAPALGKLDSQLIPESGGNMGISIDFPGFFI